MGWWMGSNFGSNFEMGFVGFFKQNAVFFPHFEHLEKYGLDCGLDYGLVYGCLPRKTHVFAKFS